MLPIYRSPQDAPAIDALRAKLSLRPLLIQGLDDETGEPKFEVVRKICRDVQLRGDAAVLEWTEKLDKVKLPNGVLKIDAAQVDAAVRAAAPAFLKALDVAIDNLRRYQTAMMTPDPKPIPICGAGFQAGTNLSSPTPAPSAGAGFLGMKFTPIERVGLYAPGGAAAYPSSVLHTAIPAQVDGVKELCLCSPSRNGQISPAVLVAAHKLGITEIYAIGGAQAIAAMAFGTAQIKAVDKIVGPGNTYVQLAKKELYGIVDIDSFAGPSEVIVLADDSADPAQVAAELLAQAEHAPGSCLLVTPSEKLAVAVQQEVEHQLQSLGRQALTREALKFASALIIAPNHAAALALVDSFAPEHLQITTRDSRGDAYRIQHAGAIFIGPFTPVAAGDYLAGPSHVLPTSGTGRFFSGLSADSFRKRTSMIEFSEACLHQLGQHIVDFATTEGFDAHAKSVTARADH
jgi:histidinol dehydrogenase